jgi:hypothetical protein
MPTFEDLRAAILPTARWLAAGPEAPSSTAATGDIAWVRAVRGGLPATDPVDRGDLLIVPGAALALLASEPDAGIDAFVERCVETRIAGLVLVESRDAGASAAPQAEQLVEGARRVGLPVLGAGEADPIAIERSAIGLLVNHRAELERQATLLETRLEQVALAGGGPQGLAAAIAGFLGRPIAIEGRGGRTRRGRRGSVRASFAAGRPRHGSHCRTRAIPVQAVAPSPCSANAQRPSWSGSRRPGSRVSWRSSSHAMRRSVGPPRSRDASRSRATVLPGSSCSLARHRRNGRPT